MKRDTLLISIVVIETIALLAVTGGLLMSLAAPGPAQTPPRLVHLWLIDSSEESVDGYGRIPATGTTFLMVEAGLQNLGAARLDVGNASFLLFAGSTDYHGNVAPPGTKTVASGAVANVTVAFQVPFHAVTHGVRLLFETSFVDALLVYEVSGGPPHQAIGISRMDTGTNWVLNVISVPATHSITTTSFLIRYASNMSIVTPPGQKTLDALRTWSGGVQYVPVTGWTQSTLQVNDVITISKMQFPVNGYPIAIWDGTTSLYQGTV